MTTTNEFEMYDELRKRAIEIVINELGDALQSAEDSIWEMYENANAPLVEGEDEDFVESIINDSLKQMIAE